MIYRSFFNRKGRKGRRENFNEDQFLLFAISALSAVNTTQMINLNFNRQDRQERRDHFMADQLLLFAISAFSAVNTALMINLIINRKDRQGRREVIGQINQDIIQPLRTLRSLRIIQPK